MRFNETLAEDVKAFGRHMIVSRDIDPLYDVLRELYKMLGLDEEGKLWFTALYLAYYNLPSAMHVWQHTPRPDPAAGLGMALPIATERRGLRASDNLHAHIADLIYQFSTREPYSIHGWITAGWGADPERNFLLFWDKAQTVYQNGRWAAFKWLDLLKNVHGYPVSAPDMRMEFCTGPKEGLQLIFSDATDRVGALNAYGVVLRNWLAAGEAGLMVDWEQLETILCNFKSLYKGKYYVGHDIDELQERIEHALKLGMDDEGADLLFEARRKALPHKYLGELGGWMGVQKDRMRAYADTRRILVRH